MNQRISLLALVVAASFLLITPASAGVLYDNGLVNANIGTIGYSGIYYGYVVSDSFTLAGTSTLTGVNLGIWVPSSYTPDHDYLYWRISDSHWDTQTNEDHGTQAFLTDVTYLRTGSVTINNSPADAYFASFSLPDLVVGPGTHFLTLDWSDYLYWDVSNGPSQAWVNGYNYGDGKTTYSNSFQILGTTNDSATPEPASIAMLLSGLALVAGLARRKIRA